MAVEIRETTVTPKGETQLVQLHISDAPPDDESAETVLLLSVHLPNYKVPRFGQIQREAMKAAQDHLTEILQSMARELTKAGSPLDPLQL